MATESNRGFHLPQAQTMSFQSGAASEISTAGNYYNHRGHGMNVNVNVSNSFMNAAAAVTAGGMVYSGTPGCIISSISSNGSAISLPGSSLGLGLGSLLLDAVPGLKHDAGLAVEWSVGEQYKLEEGLAK